MPHRIRKGKGKRWQKGQSSSSNPVSKKFRNQAQRGFFQYSNDGNSNLTAEGLAKLNAIQGDAEVTQGSDIDQESQASQQTFATMWSECTSPCFSRLLKKWDSGSEFHKEMLAILAAVTEVIKSKNGKETDTEYFAALMTTMSTIENTESLSAVISLLHMSMKRIPKTVLKAKFSEIAKELVEILKNHADSGSGLLIRSLIGCIGHLLKCQELAMWSLPSTLQTFQEILSFCIHSNPKIRKSAHNAVCSILKGSDIVLNPDGIDALSGKTHPAASPTAKFCMEMIKQTIGSKDPTTLLHILQLLKDVLATFPQSYIKSCCESILTVMKMGQSLVRMCSLRTFLGMFSCSATSSRLSPQLNAKIINALYDFQPSVNDSEPLIAWLCVMKEAHSNLYRLDSNLTLSHLPNFFNTAMSCFLSEKDQVHQVVFDCLKMLLVQCISPHVSEFAEELNSEKQSYFASKILASLEMGLKYQFHLVWSKILQLFSTYFEIFAKPCSNILRKVLLSLADLRDSYKFAYTKELDHAIGMAIKGMGPQTFLQYVPLQLEENGVILTDFPRSWLLPVFRESIHETELSFFATYFVPLAKKFHEEGEKMKAENKTVEHKTLNFIQTQIWSLLPGFCNKPTDLETSFSSSFARLLGNVLKDRPDLRMIILASVRCLIKSSDENVEDQEIMSKFSKNYIPIFLNLYLAPVSKKGSTEEGIRLSVYETLKIYLLVANKKLIEEYFDQALLKQETDSDSFTRNSLLDVMRAMLSSVDEQRLVKLYNVCVPYLESNDITTQKKSYRVLEEICSCESVEAKAFVSNRISLLQETLIGSITKAAPSSRAPRLRCLILIVKKLHSPNMKIIQEITPEVILCTKYGSEKSKRAAFDLISTIGEVMLKWEHKSQADILKDFVQLLLLGLQGSQQMVSASILALGTVIHQFKEHIDNGLLDILISNVCQLMTVPSREIVKSTLSFIKILFSILSEYQLAKYLSSLVQALLNMTDDTRQHFRLKVKEILDRLVRKFGFEVISKMIPDKYEKVLKNIRKLQARKAKKRALLESETPDMDVDSPAKKSTNDIDDILQESDGDEDEPQAKKLKNTAWIQESSANQIVDFLDPKANKNVSTTIPTESSKRIKNKFETASDGRWIITDEMGEDAKDSKAPKGKKRKAEESISDNEEEEQLSSERPQYKSGGQGIHRSIKSAKHTEDMKSSYKAKKAGGDIKKGKFDPYVYLPLDRTALNKRKDKKMKGRFNNLVEGARKGSIKGKKERRKHGKK